MRLVAPPRAEIPEVQVQLPTDGCTVRRYHSSGGRWIEGNSAAGKFVAPIFSTYVSLRAGQAEARYEPARILLGISGNDMGMTVERIKPRASHLTAAFLTYYVGSRTS